MNIQEIFVLFGRTTSNLAVCCLFVTAVAVGNVLSQETKLIRKNTAD